MKPELTTIARPYARAAFAQAKEEGQVAEWSRDLEVLGQLVDEPQVRQLIGNPRCRETQRVGLLLDLLSCPDSSTLANFVRILVHANRLPIVPAVQQIFASLHRADTACTKVDVQVPFAMSAEQQATLQQILARHFGGGQIQLEVSCNEHLIGGMRLCVGDSVIDASLRGSVQRLHRLLVSH